MCPFYEYYKNSKGDLLRGYGDLVILIVSCNACSVCVCSWFWGATRLRIARFVTLASTEIHIHNVTQIAEKHGRPQLQSIIK